MTARFINTSSHPVYVRDPQGHQRVVRPFRELEAFPWRKEEDCVCHGAHYAEFPGLLSPFPEPEQQADAQPAPALEGDSEVSSKASTGRFRATGQVIREDGSVKTEDSTPDADDADDADVASTDDDADDEADEADLEDDSEDDDEDYALEDIPGMTGVLAAALRKAGFETVESIAECQTPAAVRQLGKVRGVGKPSKLIETAQDLLGYVDEDDDE